mmetsp:Transcript_19254/g.21482  ORF Transcript_19254/g.21482 Transcript_19254/m.21482 type:complete len:85 (-) Transcript_19254:1085-1339(-)
MEIKLIVCFIPEQNREVISFGLICTEDRDVNSWSRVRLCHLSRSGNTKCILADVFHFQSRFADALFDSFPPKIFILLDVVLFCF